jgi:PAS domain S-box-containing protein
MVLADMQGHLIKSNPALQQMLGYSEEELTRMVFTEFTHPDDRDLDWGRFSELVAGKRDKYEIEKRYRKKDGGVVWGLLTASMVKGSDGRPWYGIGMVQDITRRKRAEEALRQSDQRYKDFISHSHEGVWRLELKQPIPINLPAKEILERLMQYGYIAECNLAHARNFGFATPEEMVGIRLRDLIPASDTERLESFRGSARSGWQDRTVEFRSRDKSGNLKHFLRTEIPIVENGMLVHVWGITRNITELKRAEEERQRSLEQLRALAARLQSIREEERKRVAREIHDQLGQALTAIKIDLSSLVRELPAGEKQPSKRTSSILQLVDESIQSVRRISTELRPGILDDLGLVAAIEWAGEDFQARTGTTCQLDLPPEDIPVDAECATAIFRIFQETLTNVARHADAGKVDVRVAREGGDLILEVHDNGKGISTDKLANGEALGILGMRERAMLLGGEITISSPPGNGTTVRVRIPEAPSELAGISPQRRLFSSSGRKGGSNGAA